MKQGICKLCGETKPLLKQSHIIPQFMFKGLFNSTHRTIYDDMRNKDRKPKYYQTGFFDKDILCLKCDNELLGKLEGYVAKVLYSADPNNPLVITQKQEHPNVTMMQVSNLDYKQVKLFVIALLWKMHTSKNKFYSKVNLPNHEPVFRRMLLNGDPGDDEDYVIGMVRLDRPNGANIDIIPNPQISEKVPLPVAHFLIGGIVYAVGLKRNCGFAMFPDFALKPTNEIMMPRLNGGAARNYLTAMGIPEDYANYFSGTSKSAFDTSKYKKI